MITGYDLIECQHRKKTWQLPFFTNKGWLVLAGVGAVGGIIGATIYILLMTPFLK